MVRATGASAVWHAPRIKSFTTLTYCDETIEGPLEIAREDRAEREGRCAVCVTHLAPSPALAAADTQAVVKKTAPAKTVDRPRRKKKSVKVPVMKRSVRRSRR